MNNVKISIVSQGMWKHNTNLFAINLIATGDNNKSVKACVCIGGWTSLYDVHDERIIPLDLYTVSDVLKMDVDHSDELSENVVIALHSAIYL